jgi:hypothetical protein
MMRSLSALALTQAAGIKPTVRGKAYFHVNGLRAQPARRGNARRRRDCQSNRTSNVRFRARAEVDHTADKGTKPTIRSSASGGRKENGCFRGRRCGKPTLAQPKTAGVDCCHPF